MIGEAKNDRELIGIDAQKSLMEIEGKAFVKSVGDPRCQTGKSTSVDVVRSQHGEAELALAGESFKKTFPLLRGESGKERKIDRTSVAGEIAEREVGFGNRDDPQVEIVGLLKSLNVL